jgi:hypothetical protein
MQATDILIKHVRLIEYLRVNVIILKSLKHKQDIYFQDQVESVQLRAA